MSDIKFKGINPGMVIHCPTKEKAIALLKHLDKLGYQWLSGSLLERTYYYVYEAGTCYKVNTGKTIIFLSINSREEYTPESMVEFDDLLEPEMSAEELLDIIGEVCVEREDCDACPMHGDYREWAGCMCMAVNFRKYKQKILDICLQWKEQKEKKEQKPQWYWQGEIFEAGLTSLQGKEKYDLDVETKEEAEEYMAKKLEEFCRNHDGVYIARVDYICGVRG